MRLNNLKIKAFKMVDTKRTTGRPFEEKLHVLHNLHGTIYRPDKTGRQIVPCKPALGLNATQIKVPEATYGFA